MINPTRTLVEKMMDYLIEIGALKITRIEGLAEFFPHLEDMIDEAQENRLKNQQDDFVGFIGFWFTRNHEKHHGHIDFENCREEICQSGMKTIKEAKL